MHCLRGLIISFLMVFAGAAMAQKNAQDMTKIELDMLAKLEKQYVASKSAFEKKPSDAKLKKEYIASTDKFAHSTMVSPALAPRQKYPKALRLYREIKKVDPKNAEAAKWIKTIEDIYRSMNMPIPK
jgi:hypothetical protein